jgi:hypothetical protein
MQRGGCGLVPYDEVGAGDDLHLRAVSPTSPQRSTGWWLDNLRPWGFMSESELQRQ